MHLAIKCLIFYPDIKMKCQVKLWIVNAEEEKNQRENNNCKFTDIISNNIVWYFVNTFLDCMNVDNSKQLRIISTWNNAKFYHLLETFDLNLKFLNDLNNLVFVLHIIFSMLSHLIKENPGESDFMMLEWH